MTATKKTTIDYATLKVELDSVMSELQREDLAVDTALKYYERGLQLVHDLEQYLVTAENRVEQLKAKFK